MSLSGGKDDPKREKEPAFRIFGARRKNFWRPPKENVADAKRKFGAR